MDKSKLLSQVFSTYNWLRFGLVFCTTCHCKTP
jgi:hypothetical protein